MEKRFKAYDTHNPNYQLVKQLEGDYEAYLHYYFQVYRVKNEWFKFPSNWETLLTQSNYEYNAPMYNAIPCPLGYVDERHSPIKMKGKTPEQLKELALEIMKERENTPK